MLRDHLRIALALPTAHALVDAVAVEHLPGMLRQERHDVELAPGELDGSSRHRYRAGPIVHGKVAVEAHLRLHLLALVAREVGVHPRAQHGERERLQHVVVGPAGEALERVHVLHARREKQDGAGQVLAQAAAHLEPVQARHAHVQQHEVGPVRGLLERFLTASGREHAEAPADEVFLQHLHYLGLVVGDQQRCLALALGHSRFSFGMSVGRSRWSARRPSIARECRQTINGRASSIVPHPASRNSGEGPTGLRAASR